MLPQARMGPLQGVQTIELLSGSAAAKMAPHKAVSECVWAMACQTSRSCHGTHLCAAAAGQCWHLCPRRASQLACSRCGILKRGACLLLSRCAVSTWTIFLSRIVHTRRGVLVPCRCTAVGPHPSRQVVTKMELSPMPCAMCIAGDYLVAAHTKGRTMGLHVYRLGSKEPIHELLGHTSTITCVKAASFRAFLTMAVLLVASVLIHGGCSRSVSAAHRREWWLRPHCVCLGPAHRIPASTAGSPHS